MFRRFKFIGGILLMLVVVALWGIPALIQTHGEFFTVGIGRHVVARSLMTLEGHGASSVGMYVLLLPFYFVTVFISFFPWSIKLPWLVQRLLRNGKAGVDAPATAGTDRHLSDLGDRDHLRHLYSGQHEVTALHAAGFSVACAFAGAALAPRATVETPPLSVHNHRGRNCVCVDRSCHRGTANGGAVFPRVSALSSVSRVFAAEHAICCGRVPGAKSGLVFSLPRSRFSHAAEKASRC